MKTLFICRIIKNVHRINKKSTVKAHMKGKKQSNIINFKKIRDNRLQNRHLKTHLKKLSLKKLDKN